ncbi:MAG TPA: OmpH family outer membrane protein [Candidatus Limnocylindria bacterium]|nr:OmpH family outer membrane protein [Candidatus Limnocylindria bacterium]
MRDRRIVARGSLSGLAIALAVALAAPAAAEVKIGVVDMQRALNECNAGKKAKEEVRRKFERAQNELRSQRESLDRMRESYDKKALVLKDEERRNLEKDLEARSLDFKRKYEDYQRDLKRTDAELTSGIVEQLYDIVGSYAKERGFTLVLETSAGALVYADPAIDMTDEVIKRHNAR